jgi:hypothetical protein
MLDRGSSPAEPGRSPMQALQRRTSQSGWIIRALIGGRRLSPLWETANARSVDEGWRVLASSHPPHAVGQLHLECERLLTTDTP